jgi:uncharacterized membrane protein YfcA
VKIAGFFARVLRAIYSAATSSELNSLPELAASQWFFLVAITLGAGIIQSATGFGFAVIAVPLFLLTLDSLTVIQINIVLNLVNALVVVPRIWRQAPVGLLRGLVAGTVLGLPLGMAAFLYVSVNQMKLGVALLIIGFALHLLLRKTQADPAATPSTRASIAVGGFSGALTSALAMPGPPVLIYLSHYSLAKEAFRSVNLTLYVFSYGLALVLQSIFGAMTAATWALSGMLVPVAMIGAVLGHRLSPWLSEKVFRAGVLATLLATGVYMTFATLSAGA